MRYKSSAAEKPSTQGQAGIPPQSGRGFEEPTPSERPRFPIIPERTRQGEQNDDLDEGIDDHFQHSGFSEEYDVQMREVVGNQCNGKEEDREHDDPSI
jgi:hypothetical protein